MIGKLFANERANAALVVVLSGVLSNPVPRHLPSDAREGLSSPAFGRGAAA